MTVITKPRKIRVAQDLLRVVAMIDALPASLRRFNARYRRPLLASALALGAFSVSPAIAEPREFCPTRPGVNTPSCTVDPKRVVVEIGLVDWTLDRAAGTRDETIVVGEMLLRYGIDQRTEIQLGWTAYGRRRIRDLLGVTTEDGVGDVTIAVKRGLGAPNGPVALQAYVSLPTGGAAIGARDWQASVLLPVTIPLANDFEFSLTPEIDWLANENATGHHIAYSSAIGLTKQIGESFALTVEGKAMRDDDPGERRTPAVASASIAWQPDNDDQFDFGVVKGLSDAPDLQLYVGFSRRF